MNDPTDKGLEIHADLPEKDVDIFAYVLRELRKDDADGQLLTTRQLLSAEDFVHKARELFTENQPVGMDYLESNLGLRFQDGMVLKFCDTDTGMQGVGGVSGGVEITKPDAKPRDGKGATVPSSDWGVTGEK